MPATSGSALALAARLRALDDDALTRLVTDRGVRQQGIRDFFDLAEALLDRASVQTALQRLDRPTLALLAVAGELAATTGAPTAGQLADALGATRQEVDERIATGVAAGLLGEESGRVAPWDAVVEQLTAWPAFGLPSRTELVGGTPPPALEPVSESDARFVDRGAGDRAFATVTAVTELLLALRDEPARQLARGGVALPDGRRLAALAGVESDQVDVLLDIASRAGLATLEGGSWSPSGAAAAWLAGARLERWAALASGWLERLPDELRLVLRQLAHAVWGERLADFVTWLYPAGGDWIRQRLSTVGHEAELLGLVGGATPSTPGTALLVDGVEAASTAMADLFPAEVEQVYVQHDLSIIAPGPLVAAVDNRLRGLADVEARGVASTYRVTGASLTRAMIAGETSASITEFLTGISLTGIPQPLDYLLADTAARFGTLRVGALDPGATSGGGFGMASYVHSNDTALLHQLAVDQNLAPLALRADDEHRLLSRIDMAPVYWALADARYPVVAEDAEGRIIELRRERRVGAGGALSDDTAAILVARVRSGSAVTPEETGQAWLARQLETAVKNKMAVVVSVRLPDGSDVDYHLEPASMASGRLRARDRRADIERTLPLSSITAVRPA
ncbi:helicase-associated domain-containing protein [Lysinimonas soli]|uniref:Helicase-associated domain-containing protein n=1 Tax=Lysinimonas soli TaxID=1074233 RepID=A0ABW0NKU0_9MICO